ncbi:MAG: M48 family metallopeptidase [Alphaproteobacteria bacterium]|nr:M48 family metallopeptidase [Alphaproteobacteria bacterium]MBR7158561.1 M48 family metallopeptidase [Alphaproteobacteria bacterium]
MVETIDSDFPITVRRSSRSRKMTLRVSPDYKGFVLTLPLRSSLKSAQTFVSQSNEWLLANSRFLCASKQFTDGCRFTFLGEEVVLCHNPEAKRGVWQEGDVIYVSGSQEFFARRVKDFLHKKFLHHVKEKVALYSKAINKKVSKVTVRNNTSRWGSCSCNASVSFNFYLGYAPESIIDYVVVHELCHLLEMNHSLRFWREVAKLYPSYKEARKWLKVHGSSLYAFS